MSDKCNWKGCKNEADLGYLGKSICNSHWAELCNLQEQGKGNKGRIKMGLPPINKTITTKATEDVQEVEIEQETEAISEPEVNITTSTSVEETLSDSLVESTNSDVSLIKPKRAKIVRKKRIKLG